MGKHRSAKRLLPPRCPQRTRPWSASQDGNSPTPLSESTSARRPVTGFYLAKTRLDKLVAEELGEIPAPFVVHDLRRTVRTGLARLGVNDTVAEQVIGHGRKGIERVYDQHRYEPQMRSALELWANHLLRLTKNGEVERAVVGQRHA